MTATDTRERLVSAAGDLFRRQGYHATGLKQILDESGAPRGSLYHFFPGGKEELARAAVELAFSGFRVAVAKAVADAPNDPGEQIAAVCDVIAYDLEATNFEAGCPVAAISLGSAESPELQELCAECYAQLQEFLGSLLQEGGVPRRRADSMATLVFSALEGALMLSRAERSTRPMHRVRDTLRDLLQREAGREAEPSPQGIHRSERGNGGEQSSHAE